ncbi:hypothetical protein SBY92_000171 [Candida maltosa Xu316]|uniref:Uncharacterized protein n=1 Tax=Candida maltosa (strain Xu316) TaxID=1245528 RepID=M3K5G1_CANMX|nr:hypothetical protein G210_2630 [Candida maltosa Xu316]
MKSLKSLIIGIFLLVPLILAIPTTLENSPSTNDLQNFKKITEELQKFNAQNFVPGYEENWQSSDSVFKNGDLNKRSSVPILDTIFRTLDDTGTTFALIDFVLLQTPLLDFVLDTTIWIIDAQLLNVTNFFIALEKSDLVTDLLVSCVQDTKVLPGMLVILKDVIQESDFNLVNITEIFSFTNIFPKEKRSLEIVKRDDPVLDLLVQSIKDSGLAVALVTHILTTPELAPAAAHLMWRTLTVKSSTLEVITAALNRSHLIWVVIQDIFKVPGILFKFGSKI